MSNYNSNVFNNPIYKIDPSRNNVNRIMNPSVRYFPENDQNTGKTVQANEAADVHETAVNADRAIKASDTGRVGSIKPAGKKINAPEQTEPDFRLEFTSSNIMNGFILSELLGKPKVLQKRRW